MVALARTDLPRRFSELEGRVDQLERYTADIARDLRGLESSGIRGLQQYTDDIARDLRTLETTARPMIARLNARPYRSSPPEEYSSAPARPGGFDYVGFESVFRGPEALVRQRQEVYATLFAGRNSVLDVGCGRGEFLELMRDCGVNAVGIDLNSTMVARCHSKGLANVHEADAVAWLKRSGADEYDAIFSAQFIEHIPFDALVQFVEKSFEQLGPSGLFVAETINPQSIDAFKTFYVDPSHVKPLFPEVMVFLCRSVGFDRVRVFFPNGAGFDETNSASQNEYAVVATK